MYRVFDHGSILLTDRLDFMYMLGFTKVDFPDSTSIVQAMPRGMNTTWFTAGIRPALKWADWTSTAIELGYDQVKNVFTAQQSTPIPPAQRLARRLQVAGCSTAA